MGIAGGVFWDFVHFGFTLPAWEDQNREKRNFVHMTGEMEGSRHKDVFNEWTGNHMRFLGGWRIVK